MRKRNNLTEGAVVSKLISMTIPMVFGMLSIVAFNLVDTYFIARLGVIKLAAVGFTFPVIMFVGGIALGLGVAASSVISQAIGGGDHHRVQRLATDSFILSFFFVIVFKLHSLIN